MLRTILTESLLFGAIGGLVGALVPLGVGLLTFDVLAGDATLVFGRSSSLLYGSLSAVVASLLSGLYPAWKAVNDPPVDALRG